MCMDSAIVVHNKVPTGYFLTTMLLCISTNDRHCAECLQNGGSFLPELRLGNWRSGQVIEIYIQTG